MTTTTERTARAHVFHRRHNTMPRMPMPPARRPSDPAARAGTRVLLVDLTSPWAYLVHLRLNGHGGGPSPAWWAVRGASSVPLTGLRAPGPDRERVREELAAVRGLAQEGDDIPDDVPAVVPHPRPVTAAYAEGVELGRGTEVLDVLLRAYWLDGRDIGDPEVLRRLLPPVLVQPGTLCTGDPRREWGYVVSSAREPLSDGAYHRLERWQQRWLDLGRPGPLTLVDADGGLTRTEGVLTALQH
jgi:hypothetical protein